MEHLFLQPAGMPFLELRTTLHSVRPYDAHFHLGFSMGVLMEGQTRFYLDDNAHDAARGDIVFIEPGRVHSCNPVGGQPRSYHMLIFDKAWLVSTVLAPQGRDGAPVMPVLTNPAAYAQAVDLISRIRQGTATERMLADFLAAVLDMAQAPPVAAQGNAPKPQHALLLRTGGCNRLTVADMAAKAHMRRESFSRQVRKTTGLPPQAYVHCLRIEKARQLLRQGKSIADVALETGYVDQSHFHRMFTRIVCATPGCYQRRGWIG